MFFESQNLKNLQIPGCFKESIKKIEFEVSAFTIPRKVFNRRVFVIGSAKSLEKRGPQMCSWGLYGFRELSIIEILFYGFFDKKKAEDIPIRPHPTITILRSFLSLNYSKCADELGVGII